MARLDQLNAAKDIAQLGAVLGREFSYEMLRAISGQNDEALESKLLRLVEAELVYQRDRSPQSRYLFKHALIQDATYASILRRTRQQRHEQVAQFLESHFPEITESQPELGAHHYTEAGRNEQAVGYWHQAGETAIQR